MDSQLKYMPIFRVRQEENKVLKSFDFGNRIYPCIEITKELDRVYSAPKKKQNGLFTPKKEKGFEDVYIPLIRSIKAEKVFVDMPVHLKQTRGMNKKTILFLRQVANNREKRTEYMKKLMSVSSKVIPVISTFSEVTGERSSIILQENDLRKFFGTVAYRTFFNTFSRDIAQIKKVLRKNDYLIMDWCEMELDLDDEDVMDIVHELKDLDCHIIVHRNPFPNDIKLSELVHGEVVPTIDNRLINIYKAFGGHSFSDYVGIKKDNISEGGVISPGFIYFDAVTNQFYGFRYKNGSHKKGMIKPNLAEFETTIVPAVISSDASKRMNLHMLDFLGAGNVGWQIIKNIELGPLLGESGKSAAKFKRISMEHYLHCLRCKISNGDFD